MNDAMAFHRRDFDIRILMAVIGIATVGLAPSPAAAAEAVSIEPLVKAWRDRQTRTRSFDYRCEGQTAQAKRLAQGRAKIKPKPQDTGGAISFSTGFRLLVDEQGRSRLETRGAQLSTTTGELEPIDAIEIVANGRRKTQFGPGSNVPFTSLHVSHAKGERRLDVRLLPLRLVFRAFDKELGICDVGGLSLSDSPRAGQSGKDLVVKHPLGSLTVDTTKDYVPTRYTEESGGRVVREIVLEYSLDPNHGWVPTSWNNNSIYSDGGVRESVALQVKQYRVNDLPHEEAFEIESPVGTWVSDYIMDETYLLRAGGEKRPVLAGEFDGTNHKELLATDPPTQAGRGKTAVTVVAVLFVFAAVVGLVVWRWRVTRANPTP